MLTGRRCDPRQTFASTPRSRAGAVTCGNVASTPGSRAGAATRAKRRVDAAHGPAL